MRVYSMSGVIAAGVTYFGIVFAVGFLLGALRVLLLEPFLGDWGALLLEIPVMLALSWKTCQWSLEKLHVPPRVTSRAAMGTIAFLLLMAAELAISVVGFQRSVAEHVAMFQHAPTIVGLMAQVLFSLFPLLDLQLGTN
jgi:hypothetical protein